MRCMMYTDSPKTDDAVAFIMETYSDEGVLKNPYSVEQVLIYHIQRHSHSNDRLLEIKELNQDLEEMHEELISQKETTPQLLKQLTGIKNTAKTKFITYSNAKLVLETLKPLWVAGRNKNLIVNLTDNGNIIEGKFSFLWQPKDMREGTYLIQWKWKNTENGTVHSSQKLFTLHPPDEKINSIYRNFVPREKYNFLFDKYIPPMYRVQTTLDDITPEVLVKFNKSIGQFFLELDDLAVGLVDLISPTFIPEGFLPALANFFNVQLRSENPTAWRNQIKHALSLFKKKGTLQGLKEALDKAGIRLLKLTNLWQVVSPYTWTDGFVIQDDMNSSGLIGYLSRKPIPETDLEVAIKSAETKEYFILPRNIVTLQEVTIPEPQIAVMWNGDSQKDPINLFKGDVVKLRYNYNKIPNDAMTVENYIRDLPLADQRDEANVKYPLKNWNVKLIEEDDPFYNLLIPERHAFNNPVTFGKIRTTFLYSEKAFNMDTYNGSLYNSNNPCDIDKNFVDECSGGQSSKFNVHLEFEQATDDKIEEAKEIIEDYSPFHAILHNLKISNRANEFVLPPAEKIDTEVKQKPQVGDMVNTSEAIYCQVKYRDGKVETGQLV